MTAIVLKTQFNSQDYPAASIVAVFVLHFAFDKDNKFEGNRHAIKYTISVIYFVTKVTSKPRVFLLCQRNCVEVKVRTHYTSTNKKKDTSWIPVAKLNIVMCIVQCIPFSEYYNKILYLLFKFEGQTVT